MDIQPAQQPPAQQHPAPPLIIDTFKCALKTCQKKEVILDNTGAPFLLCKACLTRARSVSPEKRAEYRATYYQKHRARLSALNKANRERRKLEEAKQTAPQISDEEEARIIRKADFILINQVSIIIKNIEHEQKQINIYKQKLEQLLKHLVEHHQRGRYLCLKTDYHERIENIKKYDQSRRNIYKYLKPLENSLFNTADGPARRI